MTEFSSMSPVAPPAPLAPAPAPAAWPKVIGIISMVYAIGGGCCLAFGTAWTFASSALMKAFMGVEMEIPPSLKVVGVVSGALSVVMALILLSGSIGTLRRRASGVRWLKRWAVLRLVLLVLMQPVAIMLIPVQVKMQMDIQEATAKRMREQNPSARMPLRDEASFRLQVQLATIALAIVPAIYPAFLGLFLSRRAVREEIARWEQGLP